MARIPPQELERLVEASGVELKRAGKDLLGRCPFHEDREASLVVTLAKNLWHCFSCQIGGGPIDWLMKARGVSFRHAVELLRDGTLAVSRGRIRALPPPVRRDADDQALLVQAIDYYHKRLKQTPEALAYLERRGLNDPGMIERFKIGFADRTLGLRLPEKTRKAGAEIRSRLQKIGLWRESGHEHFNGSIVIPVISPEGEITEVYGRKVNDNLREGTPMHLYLPGPHRGVWNAAALGTSSEIILCEALIDALTFWCAGYRNVTAAYGVEGFTVDHLSVFKRCGIERVLIAYDRDEAGDRAAGKLSARLLAEGLDCYRILFPKGMDANEYALKVQPAGRSLGAVIRKAQWLGKGAAKPISTTGPTALQEPAPTAMPVVVAPEALEESVALAPEPEPAATPSVVIPPTTAIADPLPLLDAVPLPASPMPSVPTAEPDAEVRGEEVVLVQGDRRYRVRGLKKNLAFDVMLKVNVMVSRGEAFHIDTLDLYSVRARSSFITQAATELQLKDEVIRHDLGALLRQLEALRALREPREITKPILERYQRHLYYHRKADGRPMTLGSQFGCLAPLKTFFKWLAKENHIPYNPASEITLPQPPKHLPRVILSVQEVEAILREAEPKNAQGLRDRAMLETLYSTGLRRMELVGLALYDIDLKRRLVIVREGKGRRDRVVPIGARAAAWVEKYLLEARPQLLIAEVEGLFLTDYGEPVTAQYVADRVRRYMAFAGIDKPGACHLFRHACATHMLENGADTRFIQALLGHADLGTTQIYTHVSIEKLREIHDATHPARLQRQGERPELQPQPDAQAQQLLDALAAEGGEETSGESPAGRS